MKTNEPGSRSADPAAAQEKISRRALLKGAFRLVLDLTRRIGQSPKPIRAIRGSSPNGEVRG